MKYACITSMDEKYYHRCGKNMLVSYQAHWSNAIPLFVYNENDFEPQEKSLTLAGWNLGLEYEKFQARWKNNRVKTFSKKGYSIIHAMQHLDCNNLIWMDADMIIKKPIDVDFLNKLMPKDHLGLHFGVTHKKNDKEYFSCETGFFILNKTHKLFNDFKDVYTNIYNNDNTTDLRRFYDGEIYGKTVLELKKKGAKFIDLNEGKKYKTPIPHSIMKDYFAHRKAGLKDKN
jgi:hypothetical protein